ncbi:MAG: flippase-like domain-containing protein [Ktedonobacteraceae bacterium]|nr:flippase-like domain-containing protein [Ktedonobacteraceae bacterium]
MDTFHAQPVHPFAFETYTVVAAPVPLPAALNKEPGAGGQQRFIAATRKLMDKKWLVLALRLACTIILIALLGKSLSWASLWTALLHARHGDLVVALIVGTGGIVLSAYQWRSLLNTEHIRFDLADLINLYLVGIAFSHFLPTGMGGDGIKALYVGRESGNSTGSISATVMCRVTGFLGMLLVALPVLVLWHARFAPNLILSFLLFSLLVGSMIGGAFLVAIFLPGMFKGKWARHRVFSSLLRVGTALSASIRSPRALAAGIAYGAIFWVIAILNSYSYAKSLGIGVPLYFYCVAIPLISLVAFLPISINGFGLRETAFVFVFSAAHVNSTFALLLALLLDAQALLFGGVGACIYLTMSGKVKASSSLKGVKNHVKNNHV